MSSGTSSSGITLGQSIEYDEFFEYKEKICINKDCPCSRQSLTGKGYEMDTKFCPYCGEELSERLKEIFVEFHDSMYDPEPAVPTYSCEPLSSGANRPRRVNKRVSLRQLVKIMEKYKQQVFVEEL